MSTELILTHDELAGENEKIAIARYVCRHDRQPNAGQIEAELRSMHGEAAVHPNRRVLAQNSRIMAEGFLKGRMLEVPELVERH
jgi:hypothetical protein